MKNLYSYHIFMFPFKWDLKSRQGKPFSARTSLKQMFPMGSSLWENIPVPKTDRYKTELYNEKNFFYDFTHHVLYDNGKDDFIKHFERKETYLNDVFYKIHVIAGKEDNYTLHVKSIGLNLYETGVGLLIFYLENYNCPDLEDVLRINQFGRRIYPPFFDAKDGIASTKQKELAASISIEGLNGNSSAYFEDFNKYGTNDESLFLPARFIKTLISDFSVDMEIKSVIDDRMFVICCYENNDLSQRIEKTFDKFKTDDIWYKFLFIDGYSATCQNDAMRENLIENHSYVRWQKWGSLYGYTRYSMVFLTGINPPEFLLTNFRTMYTRMAELTLIQRASILKFSDEVAAISGEKQNKKIIDDISDLYRKYIHFVNKIYFREVTAQEQGIELYDKLQEVMKVEEQVKGLDNEIGELHNYLTILEDKERNTNIELLTIISAVIIIPTLIVTYVGIHDKYIWLPVIFIPLTVFTIVAIKYKKNEKNKLIWIYIIFFMVFLLLFFLSLNCGTNE